MTSPRLIFMGERLEVDAAGLQVLAGRCDTAAVALNTPTAPVSGPPDQATTGAVTNGHVLVQSVLAAFATRTTSTATAARAAAALYTGTDEDSAHHLATVGHSAGG